MPASSDLSVAFRRAYGFLLMLALVGGLEASAPCNFEKNLASLGDLGQLVGPVVLVQ